MLVRALLLVAGIANLANGLAMLISPMSWYEAIPGVVATGPFNHHFVLDIGMAFVASGGFLTLGASTLKSAAYFAIAGATWPILHAFIHIAGWFSSGFPTQPRHLLSDVVGVVGMAAFGGVLAYMRFKGET